MRLLQCLDCLTVDELPDYDGPPDYDSLLQYVIDEKHKKLGGVEDHRGILLRVEDEDWKKHKDEILKEMWAKTTGFEPEFYASRSTFGEDAGKCWSEKHNRPTFCADFKSEKMRIQNPTKEGWNSKNPKDMVFLCDFCVVRSNVMSIENSKNKAFD